MVVSISGFLDSIVTLLANIIYVLDRPIIDLYGFTVSLSEIFFVCIAFYLIIAIFWKGAKG